MEEFEQRWLATFIKPGLDILFCGINPGRMSAMKGYHYANPANLFWKGLHVGGLTPYQLKPEETASLLDYGFGITDIVSRPTRSSTDLKKADFDQGRSDFLKLVQMYQPKVVCFNGITAFRQALDKKKEKIFTGVQENKFFGYDNWQGSFVFVIPSTSGANANFTREERLEAFKELNLFLKKVKMFE